MARGPADGGAAHGAARWSDWRQCPPWHANSLENAVLENLPRPSARRRYNARRRGRRQGVCSSARGVARRRAPVRGAPLRLWHGLLPP
uniref:Uncharacterized protein n=1 Tax=Aegilops tauschii subsp. strangulata TaxID=200361 RepID=A0A453D8H8_AEGTS